MPEAILTRATMREKAYFMILKSREKPEVFSRGFCRSLMGLRLTTGLQKTREKPLALRV